MTRALGSCKRLLLMAAVLLASGDAQVASQPRSASLPEHHGKVASGRAITDSKPPAILELRTAGHTLGFLPDRAYLAARNHTLTVEFRGTPGVMPRIADPAEASDNGMKIPKVFYEDLWPGISVTYETNPKGITESTFMLAPGADITKIRLHYNVPVSLQPNGTLKFAFSTGYFVESSPEARQEINGKRVGVPASFRKMDGEIGFQVGNFDPKYPLTIDPTWRWQPLLKTAPCGRRSWRFSR